MCALFRAAPKLACVLLLILITTTWGTAAPAATYGYIESATLLPDRIPLKSKLDTGSKTTSLSATHIKIYTRNNGHKYVRFTLSHPTLAQRARYDLPLADEILIKNRGGTLRKTDSIRPVVRLRICFDGRRHTILANLTDRRRFNTPLLLGRRSLKQFNALVNPRARYHTARLDCPAAKK